MILHRTANTLNAKLTKDASSDGGLVIGVDIGGTKVAAGVVNGHGAIQRQTKSPMSVQESAQSGLDAVVSAIGHVLNGNSQGTESIRGIGICSPGPLDPTTGVVINPPNIPCWRNFPLAREVSRIFGVPVKVDNDANAAALAEGLWGAGRGYRNVFFTIIGTGIGTGILFDGRIYHGRTGAAGEGGHMTIDFRGPLCGCGKRGCIEALAAGPAIAGRARAKLAGPVRSIMADLVNGNLELVTSEVVGQAYANGDALARQVLQETTDLLTVWLGNMIDLLEPDVLILGGGVSAMLSPFFDEIRNRLPGCCVNTRCQEIPIVLASYGNEAGIVGGAALTSYTLG